MEITMWVLTALAISIAAAILAGAFIGAGDGKEVARLKAQRRVEDLRRAREQRDKHKELGAPIEWEDNAHLDPNLLQVKHEGPQEK